MSNQSRKNVFVIGAGAAGNKVLAQCLQTKVVSVENCLAVNSTSKDLPVNFPEIAFTSLVDESKNRGGCGKECDLGKKLAKNALKTNLVPLKKILLDGENPFEYVVIIASDEGGTGNGTAQTFANYIVKVLHLPVHLFIIDGFHSDIRGLRNIIKLFNELPDEGLSVTIIRNSAYLSSNKNDYTNAEAKANEDISLKLSILIGNCLQDAEQNIDDTDAFKLATKSGYSVIEYADLSGESIKSKDDFNNILHGMITSSSAMPTGINNKAIFGLIVNLPEKEQSFIDMNAECLKDEYGIFYETYSHINNSTDFPKYIAYIVSGLPMPTEQFDAISQLYQDKVDSMREDGDWKDSLTELDDESDEFNNAKSGAHFDEDASNAFFDDDDEDESPKKKPSKKAEDDFFED